MDSLRDFNLPFPFPDALQEFSVQTSNMSTEHGISSAGAVNVVTKSGTNQIHGDVFWFVRNTALNATKFFSKQQDNLKRNQAGFTLGGPILKNKLFVFGRYQDLDIRTAPGNSQSLTAAERSGNFAGDPTIFDPLTGQPFPEQHHPDLALVACIAEAAAVSSGARRGRFRALHDRLCGKGKAICITWRLCA